MSNKKFTIRPAGTDDADALLPMIAALNEHLEEEEIAPLTAAMLNRDVLDAGTIYTVLVAESAGALIGFAMFHETWDSAHAARGLYLAELYVAEDARRSGVGRALVAGVAACAKTRGLGFVWWLSEHWDEDAHGFYATLGAHGDRLVAHALSDEAFAGLADEDSTQR